MTLRILKRQPRLTDAIPAADHLNPISFFEPIFESIQQFIPTKKQPIRLSDIYYSPCS